MGDDSLAPVAGRLSPELATRVVSALVLGILALAATYAGGWAFALFWLAAGLAVGVEWIAMTRCEPRVALSVVAGAGLCAITVAILASAPVLAIGAGLAVLVMLAMASTNGDRGWVVAGPAYAAVIAAVPPLVRNHPALGTSGIVWMFAVVWATDVAGYFVGRALGGPKLMPSVSPKKTWSGFLGGLMAGSVSGGLAAAAAERLGSPPPVSLPAVVLVSAAASVLSQLGDLGESALKRAFGVKDSGRLIPGHGGVMDRLDGFWAVAALLGVVLAACAI